MSGGNRRRKKPSPTPPTEDGTDAAAIERLLRRAGWTWQSVAEWFDGGGDFFSPADGFTGLTHPQCQSLVARLSEIVAEREGTR